MDANLTASVWARLIAGSPLDDLELGTVDGRADLRRLTAPDPMILRRYSTATHTIIEQGGLVAVRGARWNALDFSNSKLKSIRFYDCNIENCRFDEAVCQDWRMWGTRIAASSFRAADMRKSALGGIDDGKRNSFHRVDFTSADLRDTVYKSADFVDCSFVNTRLTKVNFGGSVFVNSKFEGDLDEVCFNRKTFKGEGLPENEMKGVDLRGARLHFVEFRELDMSDVRWPEGDDHIVLADYVACLDRALDALSARSDVRAKSLAAILQVARKWAGPNQRVGIVSKRDLVEAGGEGAVDEFLRLCRPVPPN